MGIRSQRALILPVYGRYPMALTVPTSWVLYCNTLNVSFTLTVFVQFTLPLRDLAWLGTH